VSIHPSSLSLIHSLSPSCPLIHAHSQRRALPPPCATAAAQLVVVQPCAPPSTSTQPHHSVIQPRATPSSSGDLEVPNVVACGGAATPLHQIHMLASAGGTPSRICPLWKRDAPCVGEEHVVWTSLGPLPRWLPGPTTRWAPGTTRLALHGT
jgi:hypothetical protein